MTVGMPQAAWAADGISEPSLAFLLLRAFFSLALVLALLGALTIAVRKWNERASLGRAGAQLVSRGRLDLGARREIRLIDIGGRILVVGITAERMDLLAETSLQDLPSREEATGQTPDVHLGRWAHRMQKLITSL
jgi:flagellar biogenesis protein FliO